MTQIFFHFLFDILTCHDYTILLERRYFDSVKVIWSRWFVEYGLMKKVKNDLWWVLSPYVSYVPIFFYITCFISHFRYCSKINSLLWLFTDSSLLVCCLSKIDCFSATDVSLCFQIKDIHNIERTLRIAKELSDLIVYCRPVSFDEKGLL